MTDPYPERYEIYSSRDATQNEHLIFKDPHDNPGMPMDYFGWAIEGRSSTSFRVIIRLLWNDNPPHR